MFRLKLQDSQSDSLHKVSLSLSFSKELKTKISHAHSLILTQPFLSTLDSVHRQLQAHCREVAHGLLCSTWTKWLIWSVNAPAASAVLHFETDCSTASQTTTTQRLPTNISRRSRSNCAIIRRRKWTSVRCNNHLPTRKRLKENPHCLRSLQHNLQNRLQNNFRELHSHLDGSRRRLIRKCILGAFRIL